MNRYHESMEHCAPPPELEEQLRQSRERCAALEEQVFRQTAEQYRNAGDVLLVQPDM